MAAKQHEQRMNSQQAEERLRKSAAIRKHVIHALGEPDDLHGVQVRWLWENFCRVNVITGAPAVAARIANSFFLTVDGDGNILESNPRITRQYEPYAPRNE